MNLSASTLVRLADESRYPTDEASALVYKFLLQFCAETEYLSHIPHRLYAGEKLDATVETATLAEHSRLIHTTLREKFPQFKYMHRFSYVCEENGAPAMRTVNAEGYFGQPDEDDTAVKMDARDMFEQEHVAQIAFTYLFEHHLKVEEDHTFEFTWEKLEVPNTMQFKQLNATTH